MTRPRSTATADQVSAGGHGGPPNVVSDYRTRVVLD
jgi:hypothetical protein